MADNVLSGPAKYRRVIAEYDRLFGDWQTRVEKILNKYRDKQPQSSNESQARFNILWSNVQTLIPATFAKLPQPEVARRFKDQDGVGRVAAMLLERALDFEIRHYTDFREAMGACVADRFLGGRGVAWVRYEPHLMPLDSPETDDGAQVTEDVENEGREEQQKAEQIDYECAPTDYVHWRDFGHSVARTWEEVGIVWRKVYMKRAALVERFGEAGEKIPLDTSPPTDGTPNKVRESNADCALVYELWDKEEGKAYWLTSSSDEFLDERDDPLELEGFFPCPKPLYATLTNDSLEPTPDYKLYESQAIELDTLSDRIDGLVRALKVVGAYDASVPAFRRLFTEGTNTDLIPVENWSAFAEKGGFKGGLDLVDLKPIAAALREAYAARMEIKSQIYEITGISDIIRGNTVASETATAQQIKGQYATLRLKKMQEQVAEFATGLIRLKAQVMCNHFQPETILKMAAADQLSPEDQQLVPQALELLQGRVLRGFRIDVAADSLVEIDQQSEKQARMEFLTAVGGFMQQSLPVVQQAPQIAPLVLEMLKFGVSSFKAGQQLEGVFDEVADKMKMELSQPKPPQPNPEMEKIKAQQQAEQMRMQAEQKRHEDDMAFQAQKAQLDAQTDIQKHQMSLEAQAAQHQQAMSMDMQKHDQTLRSTAELKDEEMGAKAVEQMVQNMLQQIATNSEQLAQMQAQQQQTNQFLANAIQQLAKAAGSPRELVRGPDGKAIGVRTVQQPETRQ